MVTFNDTKIKLLSVTNYKKSFQLLIMMVDWNLSLESNNLNFSGNREWNQYTEYTIKFVVNMVGLSSISKVAIHLCMEYCSHIWACHRTISLSLLDKIFKKF